MSERIEKRVKVRGTEDMVFDGKKAYLPHPIFQATLFAATRMRKDGEYRKEGVTIVSKNQFGDEITVSSPKTLFVAPDMGVFLATVACIQKAGCYALVDPVSGMEDAIYKSVFPISWLYDLTKTSSKGQGWYQLRNSLEVLGRTGITVEFSKESMLRRQSQDGHIKFVVDNFWKLLIKSQKGRKGSMVWLYPSLFLLPRKRYLWADAELCNKLKSDTAKGIFWQLICREHLSGTAREWRRWLNAEGKWETKKWKSAQLMPALEELAGHNYDIREDGDLIIVKRPGQKKTLTSGN